MTTVYDVPPHLLVKKAAESLRKMKEIEPPEWSDFVKTGRHRERPPIDQEWWHDRVASILRKVYLKGPIGTERLASLYGGSSDRGSKPNRAVKGSRSIVRHSLQQLEKAKLVKNTEKKGREVTPEGRKFLDAIAHEVKMELGKDDPELMKY